MADNTLISFIYVSPKTQPWLISSLNTTLLQLVCSLTENVVGYAPKCICAMDLRTCGIDCLNRAYWVRGSAHISAGCWYQLISRVDNVMFYLGVWLIFIISCYIVFISLSEYFIYCLTRINSPQNKCWQCTFYCRQGMCQHFMFHLVQFSNVCCNNTVLMF